VEIGSRSDHRSFSSHRGRSSARFCARARIGLNQKFFAVALSTATRRRHRSRKTFGQAKLRAPARQESRTGKPRHLSGIADLGIIAVGILSIQLHPGFPRRCGAGSGLQGVQVSAGKRLKIRPPRSSKSWRSLLRRQQGQELIEIAGDPLVRTRAVGTITGRISYRSRKLSGPSLRTFQWRYSWANSAAAGAGAIRLGQGLTAELHTVEAGLLKPAVTYVNHCSSSWRRRG